MVTVLKVVILTSFFIFVLNADKGISENGRFNTFDYGANSVTYCGYNNEDELKKYRKSAIGDHL